VSTVGVKELKNCLTQYLRRTKQGEEVIVTERGNPIALIQPIKSAEKAVSLEAKLARLAPQGLLVLPTQKPLRRVRLVRVSGKPISKRDCARSPVIYLDTSALIKRFVNEKGFLLVRSLVQRNGAVRGI
jgi:prevent-host-death family protein